MSSDAVRFPYPIGSVIKTLAVTQETEWIISTLQQPAYELYLTPRWKETLEEGIVTR